MGEGHRAGLERARAAVAALLLSAGFVLALQAIPAAAETPSASEIAVAAESAAGPATETGDPAFHEKIVVTASRSERRLGELPVHVSLVDSRAIELSAAQTADDLLRQIPGFNLLQQGSSRVMHPAVQSLSLRGVGGTSASRTLVLVDGIPLNDPFGGWIFWGRMPLESIERVEVVRGGGASVWGNGALGGVVHLITKKPAERTLGLRVEAGNKATREVGLLAAERFGPWTVDAGGDWFNTDGYPRVEPARRGPIDVAQSSEHTTGRVRLRHQASDSVFWFVEGAIYDEDRVNGTPRNRNSTDNERLRAGVDWLRPGGGRWQANAYSESQTLEQHLTSVSRDRTQEVPSLEQFDVPSDADGASVQWSGSRGDRHFLTVGVDALALDGATHENYRFVDGAFTRQRVAGGEQRFLGAFVRDLVHVGKRWQLDVGARLDSWRLSEGSLRERDLVTGEPLREVDFPDRSEEIFNPSLGAVYRVSDRLSLRGSAYSAFRAPTISELYRPFLSSNNRVTAANSALEPESLVGAEAGLDLAPKPGLVARVTLFWNEVEDAIAELSVGQAGPEGGVVEPCGIVGPLGTCRLRSNVGTIRNRGLELELSASLGSHWTLSGSYLYDDNQIVRAPGRPDLLGKTARQVAEHQLVARAAYSHPRLVDLSVQGRFVDDRFDDDRNTRPVDEFFVVDLRVGRRVTPVLDLFVAVENLFDERIEISSSSLATNLGSPRLARLGLRYRPFGG